MNDTDGVIEELLREDELKIPVNDKRRLNADGERVADDAPEAEKGPQKSRAEIELEAKLAAEIERREAAEAKLVGVPAKFDEAKANLEKETAEMRARMMKTLEARSKTGTHSFLTKLRPDLDNPHL